MFYPNIKTMKKINKQNTEGVIDQFKGINNSPNVIPVDDDDTR